MLHICCVRAGDKFSPAYVSNLLDMVRRNLAEGFEGEFVCFTDQADDLGPGISIRPLPADLPGWWAKLALHKAGVFPDGDRVLYLDLGCVITGRLDEVAGYDGPFATLRDFYRPEGLQSAVMAWRAGETHDIWEKYERAGCPVDFECNNTWGDQAWIEHVRPDAVRLQDRFPSLFASFKLLNGPPSKASVVCFHGFPKPADIASGWVTEVWKIGGMTRAELDVVCNTQTESLLNNARGAIVRDLEWYDTAPEHDGHVCIVGGGPSLKDCLDELAWRKQNGQRVIALNGAARFLCEKGIVPDGVLIVDARHENADFLTGLDSRTTAYLASQCHPSVFDEAERLGLKVVLWHTNTEGMADLLGAERARPVHLIGGGTTSALNAMVLMSASGYRKLHLYGLDSSYRGGDHHAYGQVLNDGDRVIDALYRDRHFKTTAWMAQQVNDFQELVPGLVADGCIITVAGDGLLPTVAADLAENMPATPAEQRAGEILSRIDGIENAKGVEVGVFAGDMSRVLLRQKSDLHLTMVDSWEGAGAAYDGDSGDFHAALTQDAQDNYYEAASRRTKFAQFRRDVVRLRSNEAAMSISPASQDFVFIDADHSYEGCKADIEAWGSRVKPGGWLCGHDYENTEYPKFGVTQAVDEFVAGKGLELELGNNFCWFVKLPAIPQTENING